MRNKRLVLSLALASSLAACSTPPRRPTRRVLTIDEAERVLWPGKIETAYGAPTEEQRRALADLIEVLWRGAPPDAAAKVTALGARAGMVVELWSIADHPTWVVREAPKILHGTGIYMIRATLPRPGRSILVQAPHVYYDLHTQRIATAMLWAGDPPLEIRGVFANAQHRYQQGPGVRERRDFNPADVAHNVEHPFQTATAAVLATGSTVVIQLHGFDGDVRDTPADAIVSAGRDAGSTAESSAVATALASTLGATVARFPEETRVLGGVTNVQGRLVATTASARFVHVELAGSMRQQLRDRGVAARLARAIVTVLEERPAP